MHLSELLGPDAVVADLKVASKKQALQDLSVLAARVSGLHERTIFEALLQREKLGTTGVGHGIAIPHGKFKELSRIVGLFARLDEPVDFDSIDEEPVDLVFVLLAPEGAGADHLKALAKISRTLRDRPTCEKIRGADGPEAIYALLLETTSGHAG